MTAAPRTEAFCAMSSLARLACILLLLVLSAGRLCAADPKPATKGLPPRPQQPKVWSDARQRQQRINYCRAWDEVKGSLKNGDLKTAETAVIKWEPEFDEMYGFGDFGFRMRMKIGEAYLRRGNKVEAMRLFRQAKPSSNCGLCFDMQEYSRSTRIARIHKSRGEFSQAITMYFDTLPDRIIFGDISRSNVWPAWRCALPCLFRGAPGRGLSLILILKLCFFTVLMFLPYLLALGVATLLVLWLRNRIRRAAAGMSGGENL